MSIEDLKKMEPWEPDWIAEMGRARARGELSPEQEVPMSRGRADRFVERVDELLSSCAFDARKNETAYLLSCARLLFWMDQVRLADD